MVNLSLAVFAVYSLVIYSHVLCSKGVFIKA